MIKPHLCVSTKSQFFAIERQKTSDTLGEVVETFSDDTLEPRQIDFDICRAPAGALQISIVQYHWEN